MSSSGDRAHTFQLSKPFLSFPVLLMQYVVVPEGELADSAVTSHVPTRTIHDFIARL